MGDTLLEMHVPVGRDCSSFLVFCSRLSVPALPWGEQWLQWAAAAAAGTPGAIFGVGSGGSGAVVPRALVAAAGYPFWRAIPDDLGSLLLFALYAFAYLDGLVPAPSGCRRLSHRLGYPWFLRGYPCFWRAIPDFCGSMIA